MIRVTKKMLQLLSAKQKYALVGIMILMLVGGIVESFGITLILPLVTSIMNDSEWNMAWYSRQICRLFNIQTRETYIKVFLVLLIAVYVIKNIYLIFEYYMQYSYTARNRHSMQKKLMKKYLHKPYAFYLNSSSGEIMRVINSDVGVTSSLLIALLQFYMELVIDVVLAVTLFLISPLITMVLLMALLVELYIIVRIMKPRMRRIGRSVIKERALVNKWILQALNGIKSIKVSKTEDFFEEKYNVHALNIVEADRKNQTLNTIPHAFIETVTVAVVLGSVLILMGVGVEIADIIPALSAFVVAAIRLLPSVNKVSNGMNAATYNEPALDNILKNIQDENDIDESTCGNLMSSKENGIQIQFTNNVCLKDVTFSYAGSTSPVLENANLKIYKGQSVGIVGTSGAGKTTAVDIMLGLLKPQSGQVLVDGVDIEENMRSWLSCLAYIPQQIFLMDDSIKINVAFGKNKEEINEEQVWNAIREAQLESFVKSLPNGIDTSIGEAGVRLSGGQRQRIGIARALYNNPDILFFDEATSALDSETEAAIMESINQLRGNKTLIIIAHRLTTIEKCDLVYKVEKGKIVEVKNANE